MSEQLAYGWVWFVRGVQTSATQQPSCADTLSSQSRARKLATVTRSAVDEGAALAWQVPVGDVSADSAQRWTLQLRFSTLAAGNVADPLCRRRWWQRCGDASRRLLVPRQVHGTTIIDVTDSAALELPPEISVGETGAEMRTAIERQTAGQVVGEPRLVGDGLLSANWTDADRGMALGVFGSDCPGLVLVAGPCALTGAGPVLVVAHCGWRGVAAGMVGQAVAQLVQHTSVPPSAWQAWIGPGISGPYYQVDAPVLQARAWPAQALVRDADDLAHAQLRAQLDLPTAVAADLAQWGVIRVTASGCCTASDTRLHSYRHQGPGLSQVLAAWLECSAPV